MHEGSTGKLKDRQARWHVLQKVPYLIVDLQIGGAHKKLALCSVPVVFNVHEDILNGPGDDTPAGPAVSPLHCEGLASACLTICNDGCIVALHANVGFNYCLLLRSG